MMTNTILRTVLAVGALALGVQPQPILSSGQPSGVGGNVAGSSLTLPTQTAAPFNKSCALNTYLLNETNLGVYCNNDNSSTWDFDWTSIDLGLCVGNNAGILVPAPSGNYASSCDGCSVTWSHVLEKPYNTTYHVIGIPSTTVSLFTPRWDDLYLTCSGCDNGAGATVVPSEFDLNQVLVNSRGYLGCFDISGPTQVTRPPGAHAVPTSTVWSAEASATSGPYPNKI